MNGQTAKPMARAVQKAAATPEGEQREYFVGFADYVSGYTEVTGYLAPRWMKLTFVFADDGTVYIPNFIGASNTTERGWIKGKLSDDGKQLTIKMSDNQDLGYDDYYSTNTYLYAYIPQLNQETGKYEPVSLDEVVFDIDKYGIISNSEAYMDLNITIGNQSGYLAEVAGVSFAPTDNPNLFSQPVTRILTGTSDKGAVTSTVEDVNSAFGGRLIKGLLPAYPDSWVLAYWESESSDNLAVELSVIEDNIMLAAFDVNMNVDFDAFSTFIYNADGSYTQNQGEYISDLGATGYDSTTKKYKFGYSYRLTGIKLGAPQTSGINSVETSKGEPVATEYYDLSGRRVDAATKGVTIRVEKYADGTSKAVKAIK